MRIGRPIASTAAGNLIVRPPRDRLIAAASAPLLRPPHRHALSRSCCRSGRIRSPVCRSGYRNVVLTQRYATKAGTGHAPLSTRRTPLAGHASTPHCPPSTGSRPRTASCPRRCVRAFPPDREDTPISAPIVRPSAGVCGELVVSGGVCRCPGSCEGLCVVRTQADIKRVVEEAGATRVLRSAYGV